MYKHFSVIIYSQYIKFFEIVFVRFLSSVCLSFKDEKDVLLNSINYLEATITDLIFCWTKENVRGLSPVMSVEDTVV